MKIKTFFNKYRILLFSAIAVALALLNVSASLAFLSAKTQKGAVNTFTYTPKKIIVQEDFNGTVKKNVTVKNDSADTVYVRVMLTSHRVNSDGDRIGGDAKVPSSFTLGNGWFSQGDGIYVYSKPVAANSSPANPLIGSDGITLKEYTDDDGGKQVIDVLAQSITAASKDAVKEKWNVNVSDDGILSKKS